MQPKICFTFIPFLVIRSLLLLHTLWQNRCCTLCKTCHDHMIRIWKLNKWQIPSNLIMIDRGLWNGSHANIVRTSWHAPWREIIRSVILDMNITCNVCMVMMLSWHGMLPSLLALCEGNPPVTGGFPSQRGQWCGALMFSVMLAWKKLLKKVKLPVTLLKCYHCIRSVEFLWNLLFNWCT